MQPLKTPSAPSPAAANDVGEPRPTVSEASRRAFLTTLAGTTLVGLMAPKLRADGGTGGELVSTEAMAAAEKLMDLELTDAERQLARQGLEEMRQQYGLLRTVSVPNAVPPALVFQPVPPTGQTPAAALSQAQPPQSSPATELPTADDDLAFASLPELASWLASRQLSSVELTRKVLARLERLGPVLECVVHRTAERALAEAEQADQALARGEAGPLTGIPWGAKDLLSARGYPTTWGAKPFVDQRIEEDATVVTRLAAAGAPLAAKLTLGALAWGDVWFGGTTRNPWNLEQGSSGSSAGSASASAAGLVPFTIGSETWGSIVSPCTRCGASGLRPTFGRVSRHGAMALSWSMDKLGPIARSVEDCALVFEAIQGVDARDPSTVAADLPPWRSIEPRKLRVGYVATAFDEEREDGEWADFDRQTLETLEGLGFELRPITLPELPVSALSFILSAEAATAFDELTRDGRDDELVRQVEQAWPNVFRQARYIPAVEYLQANRVRTMLMQQMAELFEGIDAYVCPSYGGDNLLLTNLTGHPSVVMPNGFRQDGTPTSITLVGRNFGDAEVLALGHAYQQATDFHRKRPTLNPEAT